MILIRRPWTRQPPSSVRPSAAWIARGLSYASTLLHPAVNGVTGKVGQVTGTKQAPVAWGMARGFGTTYGVGTTDTIASGFSSVTARRTYLIRYRRSGAGGGSFGRLFDAGGDLLTVDAAGNFVQFNRAFSTTGGAWKTAVSVGSSVDTDYFLAVTHDGSTAQPLFYRNGELTSTTTITAPLGSITLGTSEFYIGNRSAGDRNWDGVISDFYVFNNVLTAGDISKFYSDIGLLWSPYKIPIPYAPAAGGTPTLTDPGWLVSGNQITPRGTYAF